MADSVGRYKTIVMAGCVYALGAALVALAVPWKNGSLGQLNCGVFFSGSVKRSHGGLTQMIFLFWDDGFRFRISLRSRRMRVGSGYQPPKE